MKNLIPFKNHILDLKEKKGGQWISKAVGENPGALKTQLGLKKDDTLTKGTVKKEIAKLKGEDTDPGTPGAQLPPAKAKKYKRLNLAKTLMGLKEEHSEMENYMFFGNIVNMKRMCEDILEMNPHKVDSILSDGHGWAVDHIATSKDDVEEVYNFLMAEEEIHHDSENTVEIEPEVIISDKKEW
jgi:hypothetical protein